MSAGEEISQEIKAEEQMQWQWRLGCMGRPLPGAALEDSADDLKGIANYEGTQSSSFLPFSGVEPSSSAGMELSCVSDHGQHCLESSLSFACCVDDTD